MEPCINKFDCLTEWNTMCGDINMHVHLHVDEISFMKLVLNLREHDLILYYEIDMYINNILLLVSVLSTTASCM